MMTRTAMLLMFAIAAALSACEDDGRVEEIGEEIDEAAEDARAGGETTANRLDDAADEVEEGIEDAADEVEEAVEDAREDDRD
jgi:hypothetical protein